MTTQEIIRSEDFIDLVVEYTNEIDEMVKANGGVYSFHWFGGEYRLLHVHKDMLRGFMEQMTGRIKYEFPLPMGIMDEIGLFESGIEYIHEQPYMRIRGTGVVIAFIDTGIDYMHPAFVHPDNTTKILKIWDQTIDGTPPYGFQLGHEYTAENINRALQSSEPRSIVEHVDTEGHGTFIAGIAAGYDQAANFTGVAPEAELIIVKVKPAKRNLKEHWRLLKEDTEVYQSTDVLLGMRYVVEQVNRFMNKPLVVNLSLGRNNGPDDTGVSGSAMEDFSHRRGIALVGAAGNEGIAQHHVSGVVPEHAKYQDIELKVGNREKGCCVEILIPSPDIMSVLVRSPMNEYVEMLPKKITGVETSKLLFEKTEITVEYEFSNCHTGDQVILIKFKDPTPGIWTITLRSHIYLSGVFHAWLPLKDWIERDTYFLNPDPNYTVTMPGGFTSLISVGAYDHRDGSLHIDSGRGPSRTDNIRPDLVAPGVTIRAPWPGNGYATFTGTSAAAAMVAGSAALLLEWGIVRKNDPSMNTYKIKKYLTGGAKREKNITYPNNTWGYGKLDLQGAFDMMKI